jgi:phosphoribosylglycinamide formyltransferase-1
VHPSLLPAFAGTRAIEEALDAGVSETGVTVHFVDEGIDTGPVILQEAVPVHADDTPASLHERVQSVEHRLLPEAARQYLAGDAPP